MADVSSVAMERQDGDWPRCRLVCWSHKEGAEGLAIGCRQRQLLVVLDTKLWRSRYLRTGPWWQITGIYKLTVLLSATQKLDGMDNLLLLPVVKCTSTKGSQAATNVKWQLCEAPKCGCHCGGNSEDVLYQVVCHGPNRVLGVYAEVLSGPSDRLQSLQEGVSFDAGGKKIGFWWRGRLLHVSVAACLAFGSFDAWIADAFELPKVNLYHHPSHPQRQQRQQLVPIFPQHPQNRLTETTKTRTSKPTG